MKREEEKAVESETATENNNKRNVMLWPVKVLCVFWFPSGLWFCRGAVGGWPERYTSGRLAISDHSKALIFTLPAAR